ncbi:MAG TPA: hypothetical protein VNA04_17290 [Thermoanaerobaculia bacterium]|nr:hypothetical protein [Thermoanaerobaculia bacterium]
MKILAITGIIILALTSASCKVERTEDEGVVVSTDTAATREAEQEASEAGRDLREGARDAMQATETALREGARQTGTALEKAGKEIQEHSKPGNQP